MTARMTLRYWLSLTTFIDFGWVGSIYFKLRIIAFTRGMKMLTYHRVQQLYRNIRHLMIAVYGRNMLWERGGLKISCIGAEICCVKRMPSYFLKIHLNFSFHLSLILPNCFVHSDFLMFSDKGVTGELHRLRPRKLLRQVCQACNLNTERQALSQLLQGMSKQPWFN
jgi:hypothetical protein